MKRPRSVTIMSCLFIVAGAVGFIYHASELNSSALIWSQCGFCYSPHGDNRRSVRFARGELGQVVLLTWILYHVILSFFHPIGELGSYPSHDFSDHFVISPKGNSLFSKEVVHSKTTRTISFRGL